MQISYLDSRIIAHQFLLLIPTIHLLIPKKPKTDTPIFTLYTQSKE